MYYPNHCKITYENEKMIDEGFDDILVDKTKNYIIIDTVLSAQYIGREIIDLIEDKEITTKKEVFELMINEIKSYSNNVKEELLEETINYLENNEGFSNDIFNR